MDLMKIKNLVEKKSKEHHIEILRILIKNKVTINENSNGIFVNLSNINKNTITEIQNYLVYINEQEKTLNMLEDIKEEYKNNYFKATPEQKYNVNDLCKDNKSIGI